MFLIPAVALAATADSDIAALQKALSGRPVGERIAFWAERFVDTPYDPDPLGEYVTRNAIVADERVDCMYLVFRAVELAFGKDPADTVQIALDKRFMNRGKMKDGKVLNYEDRFQYGEDMIDSGKWGREITALFGNSFYISGSRGRELVSVATAGEIAAGNDLLLDGDLVFFIRSPEKRVSDEIVGHMGIIRKEGGKAYLIHASGVKNKGGSVMEVLLSDYLASMPFAGVRVTRFEDEKAAE